uniref:CNH domain-containing protein n=1 Tax=Steinernema glaseri TaxID=37863 RepID=A0A1I8A7S7_9BILA
MYEAYAQETVARIPSNLEVCSLATHDSESRLFAGLKSGQLLTFTPSRDRKYQFTMCKKFQTKPIQQLKAIESHNSLFCLADNQVSVHDLNEVTTTRLTLKCKGVACFDTFVDERTNQLFIAVAANRRINVFEWVEDEFREVPIKFHENDQFLDNAESLTWCGKSRIAFAIKGEYWMVQVLENEEDRKKLQQNIGHLKKLFGAGSLDKPLIVDFPDHEIVGFGRDESIIFSNYYGNKKYEAIRFDTSPKTIVYDAPYLLAILDKGIIEIRSLKPSMFIQRIQLPKSRILCPSRPGHVFSASGNDIWLLNSHSKLSENINYLVNESQFTLVIELAEMSKSVGGDADPSIVRNVVDIKRKAAFHHFCQNNFAESFALHSQIRSEVWDVIALFSDLLPEEFRNSVLGAERPAELNENEARKGYTALTEYLTAERTEISRALDFHKRDVARLDKSTLEHHTSTLQIIDTTLLKCYVNMAQRVLIASLLRLRDNSCLVPESVEVLERAQMYPELFLLYQRRGLHEKALQLLKTEAKNRDSPLRGTDKTIEYLQSLSNSHLRLIFQHASWVLADNFEKGLSIFASDCEETTRELDRDAVLDFLMRECVDAIVPYLEHLIYVWGEQRSKFHETLAQSYIAKVKAMLKDYIHVFADNDNVIRGGTEEGELGIYRKKLIRLLESSKNYDVGKVYTLLGSESFYEERAVLLGASNKHDEALYLYTSVLFDFLGAERYCQRHYDANDPDKSQVYLKLFKAYTQPKNVKIPGLKRKLPVPSPNVAEALKILKKYADSMDTVKAIQLIPKETKLRDLWGALEGVLQATDTKAKEKEILMVLSKKTLEKMQRRYVDVSNKEVRIESRTLCYICRKNIGNAVFIRKPDDGLLAHFGCYSDGLAG